MMHVIISIGLGSDSSQEVEIMENLAADLSIVERPPALASIPKKIGYEALSLQPLLQIA